MKMFIICWHIGDLCRPCEVYTNEDKAVARLYALRDANQLRDRTYSLQFAPLMDGEG